MPLHPQVVELLDALSRSGDKPLEESTPTEARAGDWARDYVGGAEDVGSVVHTFIHGPSADLPVRIYTPLAGTPIGAIVYFHGSAFTVSNIALADTPHRALANRTGCVVVAVNYQKAPEHKFPEPLDDAYSAMRWVQANARSLGVEPEQVGVGGDSAGGNLAAAVALRARDAGGHHPDLAFQLLVYPCLLADSTYPSTAENAEGYLLTTAGMAWGWRQYLATPEDGENPLASPLRAPDLSGLPPAIVITAEFDPLRDEGEHYAARLSEAGVLTISRRYDGMIHGFFWTAGVIDGSKQLFDDIGQDVRTLLGTRSRPEAAPVVLLPVFTVRPEASARAIELFNELQRASREDPGCLEYTFHVDKDDPDRFVLYERWADEGSLAAHNNQEHVQQFVSEIQPHLLEPFTVSSLSPLT